MDLEEIKQLIELLDGTDVTELVIEEEGRKIKLRRGHAPQMAAVGGAMPMMQYAPGPHAGGIGGSDATSKETYDGAVVTSPVVGTFYRAPSPESPSFVDVGTRVSTGQTLCIVEAMKLMNEIESDVSGTVSRILVENGEPVEFGQALFVITPS
jgi:acetyl-CoA carboxylase biotin carboxyl carrier protein